MDLKDFKETNINVNMLKYFNNCIIYSNLCHCFLKITIALATIDECELCSFDNCFVGKLRLNFEYDNTFFSVKQINILNNLITTKYFLFVFIVFLKIM